MKLFIALALLSTSVMAADSEILLTRNDKVLASIDYTIEGKASVYSVANNKFNVAKNTTLVDLVIDSQDNPQLTSTISDDLELSKILNNSKNEKVNSSLFHKNLSDHAGYEVIESAAIRQTIEELKKLNASSKLKYRARIAKFEMNDDFDCKIKRLKKVCSGSYKVTTTLKVIE